MEAGQECGMAWGGHTLLAACAGMFCGESQSWEGPELEPPKRGGGGFFIMLDFMFWGYKKAAATSNLYRIAWGYANV